MFTYIIEEVGRTWGMRGCSSCRKSARHSRHLASSITPSSSAAIPAINLIFDYDFMESFDDGAFGIAGKESFGSFVGVDKVFQLVKDDDTLRHH